jgi:hypothetical protein
VKDAFHHAFQVPVTGVEIGKLGGGLLSTSLSSGILLSPFLSLVIVPEFLKGSLKISCIKNSRFTPLNPSETVWKKGPETPQFQQRAKESIIHPKFESILLCSVTLGSSPGSG